MVRVGFPGGPRLIWYDRNPKGITFWSSGVLSPHVPTVRWSYTCPTGKKSLVEIGHARLDRITAAETVGPASAEIAISVNAGASFQSMIMALLRTNAPDDFDRLGIGTAIPVFASDIVKGDTHDSSTGGTIDYLLQMKLTEFDA